VLTAEPSEDEDEDALSEAEGDDEGEAVEPASGDLDVE